jgi:hypothetical protein
MEMLPEKIALAVLGVVFLCYIAYLAYRYYSLPPERSMLRAYAASRAAKDGIPPAPDAVIPKGRVNASVTLKARFINDLLNNYLLGIMMPIVVSKEIFIVLETGEVTLDQGLITTVGTASVSVLFRGTQYKLATEYNLQTKLSVSRTVRGYATNLIIDVQYADFKINAEKSSVKKEISSVIQSLLNKAVTAYLLLLKNEFPVPITSLMYLPPDMALKNLDIELRQGELVLSMEEFVGVRTDVGVGCKADGECTHGCGYPDANATEKRCCVAGTESHLRSPYCKGQENGAACYVNATCASNLCKGNLGGVKKGVCTAK